MKCPDCGQTMVDMIYSSFCKNDCDRKKPKAYAATFYVSTNWLKNGQPFTPGCRFWAYPAKPSPESIPSGHWIVKLSPMGDLPEIDWDNKHTVGRILLTGHWMVVEEYR